MTPFASHPQAMLTEIYIEAFDEELADQVWEAWDKGEIDDQTACIACLLIVGIKISPEAYPMPL